MPNLEGGPTHPDGAQTETKYTDDDRGNVVDFYYPDGDEAGSIDREYGNADGSEYYFEGSDDLKAWAIANGYAEDIELAMQTGNKSEGGPTA